MSLFVWLVLIGSSIVIGFKRNGTGKLTSSLAMYKQLTWRHVGLGFISIAGTFIIMSLLFLIPSRFLRLSWWNLLPSGNPETAGTGEGIDIASTLPLLILMLAVVILIAMMIPSLARDEENAFRRGIVDSNRSDVIKNSLGFGAVHAIMGIPVFGCLALTCAGGWFAYNCRKAYSKASGDDESRRDEAVAFSSGIHAVHNMFAIGVLAVILIVYIAQLAVQVA